MFIDTHTHITTDNYLDYQKDLDEAKRQGIKNIILVATNIKERKEALHYRSNEVLVSYGIYPSDAKEIDETLFDDLEEAMKDDTFIALGEIGLDYYWFKDNKEIQKEIFRRQIKIADKYNKPIIIHSRDSIGDVLAVLKEFQNKKRGIIHCYSGSLEMAKEFIKLGYYIGFGGVLTFKNAHYPKQAIQGIDLNYVLFETDAPYLTPEPKRGEPNKTYYVKHVYEYASKLLNIPLEELVKIVDKNFRRLFYDED